jgi:undecaprenyl-diphosphatase
VNILQAIILGIVQGLTEFIPVSSSGHLILFHQWLGVNQTAQAGFLFDMALNIGTLTALIIYFHKDIITLIKAVFNKSAKEFRLAWLLVLATIPAAVAGFLLKDMAESSFRSSKLVACALIVAGAIMFLAEWHAKRVKNKTQLDDVKPKQAVAIGLAQALAIIPGVSRSGATITTGLFAGMDRVAATRFSFLLGIPIMFGAILNTLLSESALSSIGSEKGVFIAGILAAFISGIFAIGFLLKYLAKHSLNVFAYYRVVLGVFILILAYIR